MRFCWNGIYFANSRKEQRSDNSYRINGRHTVVARNDLRNKNTDDFSSGRRGSVFTSASYTYFSVQRTRKTSAMCAVALVYMQSREKMRELRKWQEKKRICQGLAFISRHVRPTSRRQVKDAHFLPDGRAREAQRAGIEYEFMPAMKYRLFCVKHDRLD